MIRQQEALQLGPKADMTKLNTDMLGIVSNINGMLEDMNGLSSDMDGLTSQVNGLKTNVGTLTTNLSTVASKRDKLETSVRSPNQLLQKSITNQMQSLFPDFKASLCDMVGDDQAQPSPPLAPKKAGGTSLAPRNVQYASSTRYQPDEQDASSAGDERTQVNDIKGMAEMV